LNHNVVLAYAKEAANADHDEISLSRLVEQNFADVAELLILIVVDVEADELRRSPHLAMGFWSRGLDSRRRRSRRRTGLCKCGNKHRRREQAAEYECAHLASPLYL